MRQLDATRTVLSALAQGVIDDRLGDAPDPGFTRLTDVVHDVGRALAPRDPDDILDALPALAALRETLESHYSPEGIAKSPYDALRGEKATPYAAGALWATSAILYATLGRHDADEQRKDERRGRASIRDSVLEMFRQRGTLRPADVIDAFSTAGRPVDKSMVSRCLGDLLDSDVIAPAEPPESGDRRHRYYQLKRSGNLEADRPAEPSMTFRAAP